MRRIAAALPAMAALSSTAAEPPARTGTGAAAAADAGAGEEAPAEPEGDPERGAALAKEACAGCHGEDGISPMPTWPRIAGQIEEHLLEQLRDYRDGARRDEMMSPAVDGMDDGQLADLAAYYASLPPRDAGGDPERAEEGRRIYFEGNPDERVAPCANCHGLHGRGYPGIVPGGFPAVSLQNPGYTEKTMLDYRSGRRDDDWGRTMREICRRMTEDEIRAVAEFLGGQP